MVTELPTEPDVGLSNVIVGDGVTVNATPLLATSVVTTTFPVVAAAGTTATIEVSVQLVIDVATVPLNFTVLVPFVLPKLVPLIVTSVPTVPDVGDNFVILGRAAFRLREERRTKIRRTLRATTVYTRERV